MNQKEFISNRQAIALLILFINGEASIYIEGIAAKSDLWLAFLGGVAMAIPVILMFARLLSLFPGKNLFDIIEICFGKIWGKLFIIIFTWFCFHSISITLEDWSFFVRSVALSETPAWPIVIIFALPCIYGVKKGLEVLGRWSELFLPIIIAVVIVVFLMLLPKCNWSYLAPVLYDGIAPVAHGALLTFIFPMTYVVGFLTVLPLQKDKNSFYKVFLFGLLIGALILFVIYIGVILVLGPYNAASFYYPSYIKVSMINIGNFLQRLDILTAVVYVCGIFIQTCVFLMGACKGFAKLFAFSDYRFIVWPIAILAITLALYEPGSVMHYFEYGTQVWPYYILLYETVFPFLVWIVAEIKVRIAKKRRAVPES